MSDIYSLAYRTIIIRQISIVWHLGLSLYVRYILSGIYEYHYMSDIYCLASRIIIPPKHLNSITAAAYLRIISFIMRPLPAHLPR